MCASSLVPAIGRRRWTWASMVTMVPARVASHLHGYPNFRQTFEAGEIPRTMMKSLDAPHPCSHSSAEASIQDPMEALWKPNAGFPPIRAQPVAGFLPNPATFPCRVVSSRKTSGEAS